MVQYSANMTGGKLKKSISKSPTGPGIYIFTGDGKKLYIGKALNLKARLSSYLKTEDQRLLKMLSLATGVKILETDSEIEALILESQYIKKHKPAFNIMLRDDKQYGFVGFTKEEYPKIFITHQPTKIQNAKIKMQNDNLKFKNFQPTFIGPFTDIGALKTTLRYLRRIFPYCTCKQLHHNYCLDYHIGKCLGFCCLKQQNPNLQLITSSISSNRRTKLAYANFVRRRSSYSKNIKAIKDILSGRKEPLIKKMEKKMMRRGKEEKFEEAIALRNKVEKIKKVFENARVIRQIPFSPSYISLYGNVDDSKEIKELKEVLKLSDSPIRIEGYDISNIQGQNAVGVMVVFTNRRPDKKEYRKFKIHTKHSPTEFLDRLKHSQETTPRDDTAMLKEVLKRRFSHPEWQMPDLILIDGGKAQLNAAHSVVKNILPILSSTKSKLQSRGFSIYQLRKSIGEIGAIVALTKDERHRGSKIYVFGRKNPIPLSKLPTSVKNILLRIGSEAHRFAISYYRQLHRGQLK